MTVNEHIQFSSEVIMNWVMWKNTNKIAPTSYVQQLKDFEAGLVSDNISGII